MFFVYILESQTTGKWYYGSTNRIEARVIEHNGKHHHYTGGKGPWRIIFRREFQDKSSALAFEIELKKLRNKKYIRQNFNKYFLDQ